MRRFTATLSIGFPGASRFEVFEFEDDVTDTEIEEEIRDWAMGFVEWNFSEDEA